MPTELYTRKILALKVRAKYPQGETYGKKI